MNIKGSAIQNDNIVTYNGKKYQNPNSTNTIVGFLAANTAGFITYRSINKLSNIPIKRLCKAISATDNDTFKQAAEKAFSNSNLTEKGVKFMNVTEQNYANILKNSQQNLPKWIKKNPITERFYMKPIIKKLRTVLAGQNAYYNFKNGKIIINKDKMSWAIFHEMGHAMNDKVFGVGKILTKLRFPMQILTPIAILTAMFKRKKAEGEIPEGFFDKTTTFIKENAGKLAFAGIAPMVLEEGLASIKGAKLAKNLLSPENLKKLNKQNLGAFTTYLGMAVAISLTTYVISKTKDIITAPKEIKEE